MAVRYKTLGRTGLKVSVLGFGCMGFGGRDRWMGGADEKTAERLAHAALDAGVNLFDTADVYNIGQSEEMLGRALGKRRREAVIATKVFCRMGKGPNDEGLSRQHILDSADASLKRLRTDVLDLYQAHEWDGATPIEETARAFEDLVRWGKARYAGASNFMGWQLARSLWVADKNGWPRFEADQVQYSLLQRGIEEEIVPLCEDQGVGVLAWSPLAGGWLSGKYAKAKASGRFSDPASAFPALDPAVAGRAVQVLERVAQAHKATCAQAALAWVIGKPFISSAIFGATSLEQLEENLKACEVVLSRESLAFLDRLAPPRPL